MRRGLLSQSRRTNILPLADHTDYCKLSLNEYPMGFASPPLFISVASVGVGLRKLLET